MSADPRTAAQAFDWMRAGALPSPHPGMVDMTERDRRAAELALCFAAYPGALDTILRMTVFRPPVDYRLPRNGEFENYQLVREGQNQVAAALLGEIDRGNNLDRRPTDAPPLDAHLSYGPGADGAADGRRTGSDGALTDAGFAVTGSR